MSATVYALIAIALLNGKAPSVNQREATLAQLPPGGSGKVKLTLRMDEELNRTRPGRLGLMGEYKDGRYIRVERNMRSGQDITLGMRREF